MLQRKNSCPEFGRARRKKEAAGEPAASLVSIGAGITGCGEPDQ
jgi:hypothetical protein